MEPDLDDAMDALRWHDAEVPIVHERRGGLVDDHDVALTMHLLVDSDDLTAAGHLSLPRQLSGEEFADDLGPGFRTLDRGWVRGLRDRCVSMRIPEFFKQIGRLTPKAGGRLPGGRTWDQYPA